MMAAPTWGQGGQPPNPYNAPSQSQRRVTNPPPVCFNCGTEGHFVVNCPAPNRAVPTGFASIPAAAPGPTPYQQYPSGHPAQPYQPRPGPPQTQYPTYAPNLQYGQPAPQFPPQGYNPPSLVNAYPPNTHSGHQPHPYNHTAQSNGLPHYGGQPYQGPPQHHGAPGPVQYQTQPAPFQSTTNGYYAPPTAFQEPPQQWNSQHVPPHQFLSQGSTPSRTSQRDYPKSFNHQTYHQPHQQNPHMTPETVQMRHVSGSSTIHGPQEQSRTSRPPSINQGAFKDSTPSTTTAALHNAASSDAAKTHFPPSQDKSAMVHQTMEKPEVLEDGEVTQSQDVDEQWDWDYKHIFPDIPVHETVALAQPLGASFKSTPVPLIQSWSTKVPSISRYAMKDNVKDFIRSIRLSPQWAFVQADPAFSESILDGPFIPLNELSEWIAARDFNNNQGALKDNLPDAADSGSRKRSRSEHNEVQTTDQEHLSNKIDSATASEVQIDGPSKKRQKNDDIDEGDILMQAATGCTTPVLANSRGGTPFLPTDDDAWAPQPGERASSPGDPTEALLASLGVSGSPKPVKAVSLPPYVVSSDKGSPLQGTFQAPAVGTSESAPPPPPPPLTPVVSQTGSIPPRPSQTPQFGPPSDTPSRPDATSRAISPVNSGYSSGALQQGPPVNQQYGPGGPSPYTAYQPKGGMPRQRPTTNPSYQNNPPANVSYAGPQYGPPPHPGATNFPPSGNATYNYPPPQNYAQPPAQQYGPAHYQYRKHTPLHGAPPYSQYGQSPQAAQYGSQQYGGPMSGPSHMGAPTTVYHASPTQYGPPSDTSFTNGPPVPGPYGPQQYSPAQYEPPHGQPYMNQYPSQPYSDRQNAPLPHGSDPQNTMNLQNPHSTQGSFTNGFSGQMPPRQDSGYGSARGSYSNGSVTTDRNDQSTIHVQRPAPHFDNQNGFQQQRLPSASNHQSSLQQQGPPTEFASHGTRESQSQQHSQQGKFSSQGGQSERGMDQALQNDFAYENGGQQKQSNNTSLHEQVPLQRNYSHEEGKLAMREDGPDHESTSRKSSLGGNGDSGDSPLSPTSAEILGKLEGKSNAAKADRRREEGRKKKPQPVVAAAYSRRW